MKRWITFLLCAALVCGCCTLPAAASGGLSNFRATAVYREGQFDDVKAEDWYHDNVAAVYELGLMIGAGAGFNAQGNISAAEALTLCARIHSIYRTGKAKFEQSSPWYQVYLDYCLDHGILEGSYADYDAALSRRDFATLLAHSMPASALPAINELEDNAVPDVRTEDAGAAEIYRLYRAGILRGGDAYGSFQPAAQITRAEVAAMVTRMAYRSLRLKFDLQSMGYPDLPLQPRVDDSFFVNAAMLGNSLVQGMQMFSGIQNIRFFGVESTSVFRPDGRIAVFSQLLQGRYDRVYIEYGINELGSGASSIVAAYGGIIDRIRQAMPGVEIYVMSMTPVTYQTSTSGNASGAVFSMNSIRSLNAALREMCIDKQCWYVDCCEALCDATGYLPEYYMGWDNSPHLAAAGYQAWAEVLRTHYHA